MQEFKIRRATTDDVDAIYSLTAEMAERGFMLPRTKYKIITMLTGFHVAENDEGTVVGCGAFSMLWTDMGEIMALAVDDAYWGKGVGKQLVESLISEGRRLKVNEVFTLTYQVDFFTKLGFSTTDKDRFPRKLWRECLECPKLENCDETAMHLFI
jgi:amino-acid N-acetyltransferase